MSLLWQQRNDEDGPAMTIYLETRAVATELDRAIEAAQQEGAELVLLREGMPVARVLPFNLPENSHAKKQPRIPGIDAGRWIVPKDILEPLPEEITELFYR